MGMIRALLSAAISLVIGFAITLAFALGFALRGVPLERTTGPESGVAFVPAGAYEGWILHAPARHFGATELFASCDSVSRLDHDTVAFKDLDRERRAFARVHSLPLHLPTTDANFRHEYHFGWPCRALWAAKDTRIDGCFHQNRGQTHAVVLAPGFMGPEFAFVRIGRGVPETRAIATGILPWGLFANIAMFSAAAYGLLFVPVRLRRHLRRRRGHCPGCNYDLRATPAGAPCPECGVSLGKHCMHRAVQ